MSLLNINTCLCTLTVRFFPSTGVNIYLVKGSITMSGQFSSFSDFGTYSKSTK